MEKEYIRCSFFFFDFINNDNYYQVFFAEKILFPLYSLLLSNIFLKPLEIPLIPSIILGIVDFNDWSC